MTTANRNLNGSNAAHVVSRLAAAIGERNLTLRAVACEIGVTLNTLERHIKGEHVRSDSLRKYEDWLAGRTGRRRIFREPTKGQNALPLAPTHEPESQLPAPPKQPHLVVDIFSGCGGLSLGFDILDGGKFFRTVLAMDSVPATVEVMNRNHSKLHGASAGQVARVADLTEFLNETEVVAFYLNHVVGLNQDDSTRKYLDALSGSIFPRFLSALRNVDREFLDELTTAREARPYREVYDALDKSVLGQTSVIGFQDALKLPRVARSRPALPTVIWADVAVAQVSADRCGAVAAPPAGFLKEALELWERELSVLEAKKKAHGRGQLTSSATRIRGFANFLRSPAISPVRDAWCRWQARRLALRQATFQDETFARGLRALYDQTYSVAVLLGGPPCQGFSRIGRGKIRSLREAHVHVHGDDEAGDVRNHLYQRYLLVVSALRPVVFKFENVQHFQSTVKTEGREFLATEVLAEAIADMSGGQVSYAVASRTVDASKHGVPQTRQRYFMSGLRRDAFPGEDCEDLAARCLTLPAETEVPLSAALEGLPSPGTVGGDVPSGNSMSDLCSLLDHPDPQPATAAARYRAWVRQPTPGTTNTPATTDAQLARAVREDDAALFALFGPGKRWMDYRVDESPTLAALRGALGALAAQPPEFHKRAARAQAKGSSRLPSPEQLNDLLSRLDGALALRLLMEQVGERLDAPHHLVSPTYLSKRDGNHGDWLARLDGTRPCKTIVAHMAKDTYGYVHPSAPRTLSVREAARVQTFPDWYSFGSIALTDALKMIGNAVPPLLSNRIASRVAIALSRRSTSVAHLIEAA
jgi:site-specific DNA-cytosine methylase